MNAFAESAVTLVEWCVVQVSLFAAATIAVYWLARRQGANRNALLLSGGLAMIGVLTLASASPWPHWGWPSVAKHLAHSAAAEPVERKLESASAIAWPELSRDLNSVALAAESVEASAAAAIGQVPAIAAANERRRFLPFVYVALAVGVSFGVYRFVRGTHFVRAYRRHSTLCDEVELLDEFQQIRRKLGIRRPVELRESASIAVPATLGWRRPVVLLPSDWRAWTANERRAVFAHELAHVALGHFPLWVVSQLAIAIHFYQPLVHWLGRRLRFEQELAADELAITAFGSRRGYADVLARLALAPCRPAASRATLGLFMSEPLITRRIVMLRTTRHATDRRRLLSTSCAFAALLTAAFFVAGFRATPTARAAEELGATSGAPFKTIDDQAIAVTALLQVSSEGNSTANSREDWKINIRTQATILGSRIVLDTALKRPEIAKLPLIAAQPNPTDWVADRLTVAQIPDSEILHVQMKGAAAEKEQLRQIVDAIVKSYLEFLSDNENEKRDIARRGLEQRLATIHASMDDQHRLRDKLTVEAQQLGMQRDLQMRAMADISKAKADMEAKLAELQTNFMVAEQQLKQGVAVADEPNATEASSNAVKLEIEKLRTSLDTISTSQVGDGESVRKQVHLQLQQLLDQLNSQERRIREHTSGPMQTLRKEMQIRAGVLQQQIGALDKALQERQQQLNSMTQITISDEKDAALKRQRDVAAELQSKIEEFEATADAAPRVRVIQWAM